MTERINKLRSYLAEGGIDAALVVSNVHMNYLTGTVTDGWLYVPAEDEPISFVRSGEGVVIRKPEQIPEFLDVMPKKVMLEDDYLSARDFQRLSKVFPDAEIVPDKLRDLRAIKDADEIEAVRQSGLAQSQLYADVKELFKPGMTDYELEAAIEYRARLLGDTRLFRLFGGKMELPGGSLLCGDNAGACSPYDFAMGGRGMHPFNPIGACGTVITPGSTVMVDYSFNKQGYLADMTRTYGYKCSNEQVSKCMNVAAEILDVCGAMLKEGVAACEIYDRSVAIVKNYGLYESYMECFNNTRFLGHGVGLEINELPVITRTKAVLKQGMVIALEPKFFIKGVGAAGLENTYLVGKDTPECLTPFTQELIQL